MELQKLYVTLTLEAKKYADGLRSAVGEAQSAGGRIAKALGDGLKRAGQLMAAGIAVGTAAIGAGFVASVNSAADFQQAMSNVGAISLASADDLSKLEAAALSAGSTTAFTATQAAEGLAFLAMAGFDVEESITALPSVLAAASAGNMDLATTADIVSNVLGGFRLDADEAKRAADVLAMTSANSNTNIEMLGQTMKFAAPTAANLGWSLEEVAAAAGFLADAGIQSSLAGTHLRAIMGSLATPTQGAQKALEGLGVSVRDAEGNMKSAEIVVTDLENALGDVGPAQRDFALNAIFGREAAGSFSILLGRGGEALGDYAHELEGATEMQDGLGAAGVQAEMQLDNFRGAMTLLRSAVDGAMVAVGSKFLPALQSLAEAAIPMVEGAMSFLLPIIESVIDVFERFFFRLDLGLSPTRALVGALKQAGFEDIGDSVQFLSDKFFEMKDVVMGFVQPIIDFVAEHVKLQDVLIALGIIFAVVMIPVIASAAVALAGLVISFLAIAAPVIALIAVVALLRKAWENDWGGIQGKTAEAIEFVKGFISDGLAAISAWWAEHGDTVITTISETFTQLKDQFWAGVEFAKEVVERGVDSIKVWWVNSGRDMVQSTGETFTQLKDQFFTGLAFVAAVVDAALARIDQYWQDYGKAAHEKAVSMFQGLGVVFSVAMLALYTFVQNEIDKMQAKWEAHKSWIIPVVEGLWKALVNFVEGGFQVMKGLFDVFMGIFTLDFEMLSDGLIGIWEGLWKQIQAVLSAAGLVILAIVADLITSIVHAFQEHPWVDVGKNLVQGFINGMTSMIGAVADAAMGLAQAALDAISGILNTDSPSKATKKLGEYGGMGFSLGFSESTGMVAEAAGNMAQAALDAISDLDIAGKMSSVMGSFTSLFNAKEVKPLENALKGVSKTIVDLAKETGYTADDLRLMTSQDLNLLGMLGTRGINQELIDALKQESDLLSELAEKQEKLAEIERQKQDLAMLQAQQGLLDLVKDNDLNADILSGLTFGLDADLGAILAATSAAMQQMLTEAASGFGGYALASAMPMSGNGGGGSNYTANTTVNVASGDDPLRTLRASRLLDKIGP